ncbi:MULTISPECIES: hypothetical protein [Candidatus Accumulibacter]|uniref:Uncharacterized protein n=1 Tax=Candidatus Accumulibacter cognatus TaxID=2954383 RepID=A0A080M331_9PROT|nr:MULTISPECIES: hypothetical protein [Candidatus Accumulibacter]KFB75687.1 MAG: hypothetical protein AW06_003302 [Candidatus Accumulibacter cognatus]MBL8401903.1 hypothetical protein [Accumulibacter sp.]MCM8621018.1 hypothetical protein [Accumulibacter sp.]HMW56860.1 hypothetical protein [Accumulibacter sp.]HNC21075.1 hypothetical protein [Accumulibacter sp.]
MGKGLGDFLESRYRKDTGMTTEEPCIAVLLALSPFYHHDYWYGVLRKSPYMIVAWLFLLNTVFSVAKLVRDKQEADLLEGIADT